MIQVRAMTSGSVTELRKTSLRISSWASLAGITLAWPENVIVAAGILIQGINGMRLAIGMVTDTEEFAITCRAFQVSISVAM